MLTDVGGGLRPLQVEATRAYQAHRKVERFLKQLQVRDALESGCEKEHPRLHALAEPVSHRVSPLLMRALEWV